MNRRLSFFAIFPLILTVLPCSASTTHYVNVNGTNPVSPYTSWATAATNIQDAVVHASFGDTVLVTNGVYQFGGDSFLGSNRVDDISSATIMSVNGPAVTTIVGYQVPGTTNGASAIRCVYLREFGVLSGFTLTGGATATGGGSSGGVAMDSQCTVSNCIIAGNVGYSAGGVYSVNGSLVVNSLISNNVTTYVSANGGGAYGCILSNCVVKNNKASTGGGLYSGTAYNCLFTGNGSTNIGSGTDAGAAYNSTLVNCTVVGNYSYGFGAVEAGKATNCIVYYNINGGGYADCYQCALVNSCTTIGLGTGSLPSGSISNAPGFVDLGGGDYHLNPFSRCIDAGTNGVYTNTVDLDGNPRLVGAAVDMGCYENQSPFEGSAHYVSLHSTNPVAPFTTWLTAATNIQDAVAATQPGDTVLLDDGNYNYGNYVVFGSETNRVLLTNGVTLIAADGPLGASIVGTTQTRCVYVGSNSVLYGLTITNGRVKTGGGDLTNEESGGGIWCEIGGVVSNCVVTGNGNVVSQGHGGGIFGGMIFNTLLTNNANEFGGGAANAGLFNCVLVTNTSAGGYGGGIYQCTLTNGMLLNNFAYDGGGGAYLCTLRNCYFNSNNSTLGGGGADYSLLYSCTLTNNQGNAGGTLNSTNYYCRLAGNFSMGNGGGVQGGYAFGCLVINNRTRNSGGGIYNATVVNCTVVSNTATVNSGGTANGAAYNSIIYFNSAPGLPNASGSLNYCCTFPLSGSGSFTNAPIFVNAAAGDYHESSNSPTINGGWGFYTTNLFSVTQDYDGNPRNVGGYVDVGAYEYQGANQTVFWPPIPWLRQYGLATDGSANYIDSDGDGMNNWQEWISGTRPNDASSVLSATSQPAMGGGVTITWLSGTGITYFVQRGSDLTASPIFTTIQSNIAGQIGRTSYTDTTATNNMPYFYRVGVQ